MEEETAYMPLELLRNIILVKQMGKDYVNYKALSKVLFTHTHTHTHTHTEMYLVFLSYIQLLFALFSG